MRGTVTAACRLGARKRVGFSGALVVSVMLMADGGCRAPERVEGLAGIGALRVTGDGIEVEAGPPGAALMLMRDGRRVEKATVGVGGQFAVSDAYHASATYRLMRIDDGAAVFRVTDRFDARAFGDGVKRTTRTIVTAPYDHAEDPRR